MWDELENALAWYAAAPARWAQSAKQDLSAAAEWMWVVLQGDFAEEQSTAQTVTSTVIAMIPFVDQICDVRDIVANCRKIKEDSDNKWAWIGLVLTLIGLFPTLGSLAKGCFKILFAYGRKGVFKAGTQALESNMWQATKPWVEAGIVKLNEFLARPAVRKAVAALKWDNVYKELATLARELSAKLSVAALTKAMDDGIAALKKLIGLIQKWGSTAMGAKAGQLLQMVVDVRNVANKKLAEVVAPVQDWLGRLAQRLDVEARLNYRASTNAVNPHSFVRPSLDAEIDVFKKKKPEWTDVRMTADFEELRRAPTVPVGHFDISAKANPPLKNAFKTFHTINPDTLPPGTVIYRVLDPKSNDNSICWMSEAVFKELRSKSDWRRRLAVWGNWNNNGEYLKYTVPPGKGMPVWRGKTASQQLKQANGAAVKADDKGNTFWLEGGDEQIVVNPKLLDPDPKYTGKRDFTGWGYDEFGQEAGLIGVPILQTNWRP